MDDRAAGWRAQLKLRYAASGDKTVLREQRHRGPLMVQKPFYPEGPYTCHTYLIHPPGGVVGGDKLGLEVKMDRGAHALITTPASGKYYRSAGPRASQINRLTINAGATLEWLPQETIVYNGANAKMHTVVQLQSGARFFGWEMICLGLPASGQPFIGGQLVQRVEVLEDNRPIFIESFQVRESDPLLNASWGLAGQPVTGTMIATTGKRDLLEAIRQKTSTANAQGQFAVTRFNGLTICRFLGHNIYAGFKFFMSALEILRPAIIGKKICRPRIWNT
jgi:urease accessory protein